MEVLCKRIDTLVVEYLELVAAYQARVERVALYMNQGFLQLTQAKFIMGQRQLSSAQYDRRMQATTSIHLSTEDTTSISSDTVRTNVRFQLRETSFESVVDHDDDDGFTTIDVHSPTTPRHRVDFVETHQLHAEQASLGFASSMRNYHIGSPMHPAVSTSSSVSDTVSLGHDKEAFRMTRIRHWKDSSRRDPITWFGVLVPGALREAQTQFRQYIVYLANLRANMLAHEQEIKALLIQKQKLLSQHAITNDAVLHVSDTNTPTDQTIPEDGSGGVEEGVLSGHTTSL